MSSRIAEAKHLAILAMLALAPGPLWPAGPSLAGEPPALNPFAPIKTERDDAVPGYVEMSDGKIYVGNVYMTRDKRLKLYDEQIQRQREIPLRVVNQIECKVLKEWMEKEWRFKEMANDEKYYTGREYPSREYSHTITLADGRTISGPLSEVIYIQPYAYSPSDPLSYRPSQQPDRVILHKRDKGDIGADLKALTFVRLVKLGEDALAEGRKKQAAGRRSD